MMILYMAGGITGNLRPLYYKIRGGQEVARFPNIEQQQILESYYYARDNDWIPKLIPMFKEFLLDSGAFTFMQNTKSGLNWNTYVEQYAEFINHFKIQRFIELDIDTVVGLKEVERLRHRLEALTGKQPIPVWHASRGREYFDSMCKDYKYVAIGGIVTEEIERRRYEMLFPWFINKAHENGCKIHGLGYTSVQGLHKYHFNSVDSCAWLYGNRGGYLYKFNEAKGDFDKIKAPQGYRLKSSEAALFNYKEWNKFQQYALRKL